MQSPYGENEKLSFADYVKNWGFISLSKTKILLILISGLNFFLLQNLMKRNTIEDKEKVLAHYNSLGYRDAQILADTMYYTKDGNLNIDLKVTEGRKYYFGNIAWRGNTKYSDSLLNAIVGN